MRLHSCLLLLVLSCTATAGIKREEINEKAPASLPCPHPVEGDVTWSRERNGHKVDLITVVGERENKHIDPGRFTVIADRFMSLYIRRTSVSDSGRYFCNDQAAVELTVIPSGTIIQNAAEKTSVTLTCPHDAVGSDAPTWSNGTDEVGLQKGFYVSPVDRKLYISSVQPGHSGLYYCNGEPAVYLNVIKGDKTTPTTSPTTTRTSRAATATTPPTTTKKQSVETKTPGEEEEKKTTKPATTSTKPTTTSTKPTTKPTTTSTKPTTKPTTTSTKTATTSSQTVTSEANTDPEDQLPLVFGIIASVLLLLLLLLIVFFTWRRFKRRGNEERCHVYDEIQDGFSFQTANSGGSAGRPTATYCMAQLPAGSNPNDHTYSTISDPPPVGKTTNGASLPNESPYSVIGGTFIAGQNKDPSEPAGNTYHLLQRPKTPGNTKDQYL